MRRRDVEEVNAARLFLQRSAYVLKRLREHAPFAGIVEIEDARPIRGLVLAEILANGLDARAPLLRVDVASNVSLRDRVEFWREFDSHDPPERKFRGQQQGSALAGAEVDERKILEADLELRHR